MIERRDIFGLPIDAIDRQQLLRELVSKAAGFRYVVTPNVDHMVRASRDPGLKKYYETADFSVCDSKIVALLARLAHGTFIQEVITGSDLTAYLFEHCIDASTSITIIGGEEDVIQRLLGRYSVGEVHHYNPPMGFADDPQALQKTVDFAMSRPSDFIFLCVGSPRQELVAYEMKQRGGASGVAFCVGASILFLTGDEKRAPQWVQSLALEWLYRLLTDPRRMYKRYLLDSWKIFGLFARDLLRRES